MKWRAAIKIAYDGRSFMGSQRQPGQRTVEDEILFSLKRIGAIESPDRSRFKMASRTDRGVSALGNVAAFDTRFPRDQLLRALNARLKDVFALALAVVTDSFTPTGANQRWYRYLLPALGTDVDRMIEVARLFQGSHDFIRFCRKDSRSTIMTIDKVGLMPVGDFLVIDYRAKSFLWNMIRRMVASVHSVGRGDSTIDEVERALEGQERSFGLAPAENLYLMDVYYNFTFDTECPDTLMRKLTLGAERAFLDLAFYRTMREGCQRE